MVHPRLTGLPLLGVAVDPSIYEQRGIGWLGDDRLEQELLDLLRIEARVDDPAAVGDGPVWDTLVAVDLHASEEVGMADEPIVHRPVTSQHGDDSGSIGQSLPLAAKVLSDCQRHCVGAELPERFYCWFACHAFSLLSVAVSWHVYYIIYLLYVNYFTASSLSF